MSAILSRAFAIVELLANNPEGMALGDIASRLNIPASATHRLVNELVEMGYMRRSSEAGDYAMSMKIISLSLNFLSEVDLVDQAKPSIDRLALASGALARLGIADEDRLIWVLKSQGSTSNIRYDPPMHHEVQLAFASGGHAWLSQLSDEDALEMVFRQGLPQDGFGPRAPHTIEGVLEYIHAARDKGHAKVTDTYEKGITAVAVPIINPTLKRVTGVLSVAGLNMHMTDEFIAEILPILHQEAATLSQARLDYVKYLLPARHNPETNKSSA